ncbi:aldo/keto reductase [Kitasatospora sp. DSM 101779]|uniref:aldo/keto reductase n=1 Tax=Kitasatospora sp. DSM 101779 TaxID=2853165 RepID=UPI0021D855E9|nr:aldo/keto reductase [Kitasatospora sp. DSM 101779]MCU7820234.1 aldo/keto reductase [Kitasatospora sp. DSM 101779]
MHQNILRSGPVRVSELAFGAAAIGNLFTPVTDAEAEEAVAAAWEAGVRYFDTAPHYGLGLSERRLGDALHGLPRDEYVISTKVGRLLEPAALGGDDLGGDDLANGFAVPATHRRRWDFSAEGVRHSIEDSLNRLGLDRVDIAYLHDPDEHLDQAIGEAYPELARLRAEGVVSAIGVGMNQAEALARFVRETDIDVVLLAGRYSLLDQRGLTELLPLAAERGVGVVVGGVFNSGLLADPKPGATFDYAAAPDELLCRALELKEVCEWHGVPLRAAALRFPFGHPAVASVLVGTRTAGEVRDAAAMLRHPIPDVLWAELKERGLLPEDVPTPGEAG